MLILSQLGQFIAGISVFAGAIVAALTLFLYHRRQISDQWADRFRELYSQFWLDEQSSEVRKWILNDLIYADVEAAFAERNKLTECNVSRNTHEILEKMDRFCAVLVTIRSFPISRMTNRQKELWGKLLSDELWINHIAKKREMAIYVHNHWKELGVKMM